MVFSFSVYVCNFQNNNKQKKREKDVSHENEEKIEAGKQFFDVFFILLFYFSNISDS